MHRGESNKTATATTATATKTTSTTTTTIAAATAIATIATTTTTQSTTTTTTHTTDHHHQPPPTSYLDQAGPGGIPVLPLRHHPLLRVPKQRSTLLQPLPHLRGRRAPGNRDGDRDSRILGAGRGLAAVLVILGRAGCFRRCRRCCVAAVRLSFVFLLIFLLRLLVSLGEEGSRPLLLRGCGGSIRDATGGKGGRLESVCYKRWRGGGAGARRRQ